MAASAEHPAVTPDGNESRPITEPARASRDSDPELIEQRMQAALAASTRTEASLSTLSRAVREMTDGLSGAREANEQMVGELGTVRRMLRQATERNAELDALVTTLKAEHDAALGMLAHVRAEADRDRTFLVEEQDRFLSALLEEHEEAVEVLEAKSRRVESGKPAEPAGAARTTEPARPAATANGDAGELSRDLAEARRNIERLMRERDRSREVLRRLQAQRDEAQRALDRVGRHQDAIQTAPRVLDEAAPKASPVESQDARKTDPLGPMHARAAVGATGPDERSIFDRATAPPPLPVTEQPFAPAPSSPMSAAVLAPIPTHPTPPLELRAAITAAAPTPPQRAATTARLGSSAPTPEQRAAATAAAAKPLPLLQKPDPASRPIGGYSLQPESSPEEVAGARLSSKPPGR